MTYFAVSIHQTNKPMKFSTMKHYITLSGGLQVSIPDYCKGVRLAKANLNREFKRGLTCWWPCSGQDIVNQFVEGIHDRINQKAHETESH